MHYKIWTEEKLAGERLQFELGYLREFVKKLPPKEVIGEPVGKEERFGRLFYLCSVSSEEGEWGHGDGVVYPGVLAYDSEHPERSEVQVYGLKQVRHEGTCFILPFTDDMEWRDPQSLLYGRERVFGGSDYGSDYERLAHVRIDFPEWSPRKDEHFFGRSFIETFTNLNHERQSVERTGCVEDNQEKQDLGMYSVLCWKEGHVPGRIGEAPWDPANVKAA